MTSSIQVSEEMIEAGRKEVLRFEDRDDIREILPRIYLAMRSKDHSIAVDDVERVATAMLAPLGYVGVKSLAEAESIWVGSNVDDAETGRLAYLCRSLARAAITAVGSQSIEGERFEPMLFEHPVGRDLDEWRENVSKTELYRRGDTVLIWVNEGDICDPPFVKRYGPLAKDEERHA